LKLFHDSTNEVGAALLHVLHILGYRVVMLRVRHPGARPQLNYFVHYRRQGGILAQNQRIHGEELRARDPLLLPWMSVLIGASAFTTHRYLQCREELEHPPAIVNLFRGHPRHSDINDGPLFNTKENVQNKRE
jgi:hypothetical protein